MQVAGQERRNLGVGGGLQKPTLQEWEADERCPSGWPLDGITHTPDMGWEQRLGVCWHSEDRHNMPIFIRRGRHNMHISVNYKIMIFAG